jgi:DNA-binding SARP family transcriptional activator
MLRLSLLGPPVVTVDGQPVAFDTRKATALLALLAIEARPQPRDRLAALLWPDADATRARSALRRTLSVTASAVGDALVAQRSVVALDLSKSTSDVAEFDALLKSGDVASFREAIDLWRDDFLAGFSLRDAPEWEDWQERVADVLRRQLAATLGALVDADIAAGDLDSAVKAAERWLALDPLHEPAHCALIRLHAWRGDRSAAMRQYRACVRTLDTELGVEPLAETRALYDAIRRDELAPPERVAVASEPKAQTPASADPAPRVVGRDAEQATIHQAFARAANGQGVAALVTGATGSGKSTLLRGVAAHAPVGALTTSVRGHPDEAVLAFGVVIELLRGLLGLAPDLVDRLPKHVRAELARMLPELAELDHVMSTDVDDPAALARLYSAVRDALGAADAACVLVVDDAQWMDAPSADVLAYLVRRIATTRIALVIAVATDGVSPPSALERAIADAIEEGAGVALRLGPLTHAAVRQLAGDEGTDVDQLMTDTGGTPALVAAWLDAARRGDDPRVASSSAVDEMLGRRVQVMSQTTHQVLAAAAVLGGRIDPDVLRETSGRSDTETVAAVEEALRAGLLVEIPGGGGYDLAFESLRRLITAGSTLARTRLLHHRAASALVRRAGGGRLTAADAGAIAQHFQQAGLAEEAAQWHWRAAQEARALHAHEEALGDVRAALSLGFAPASARLAEGELLIALGRYDEAITALELSAAAAPATSTDAILVERRLADVHHRLGDFAVAEVHLDSALEQADGLVASADVAVMLGERALLAVRRDDVTAAETYATSSLALAATSSDDAAIAYALNASGVIAVRKGDVAAAETQFRKSVESAQRAGASDSAIAALNNLARLLSQQGRHDEALAVGLEALDRGEQVGDRHRLAALHTNLADLLRAMQRPDESMSHLKQAAAMFAAVGDDPLRRPEIWKLVEW